MKQMRMKTQQRNHTQQSKKSRENALRLSSQSIRRNKCDEMKRKRKPAGRRVSECTSERESERKKRKKTRHVEIK